MDNLLVSVIIPTYNSEKTLAKCLESIKNQTYDSIEILVVDKNSEDRTIKIARKHGARVFVINAKERCEQVNFGMERAKGKYLYRVDSDFIVERNVVQEAVEACENGYDAICVHNTSDPTVSFWSKVRKLERDCYQDDELNVAARFFRKDVFKAVGGFDENLVALEDYDFHNRLLKAGFKIGRTRAKEVHVGEPKSILEIAKKFYYYGKTIGAFIKANPQRGMKQLIPLRSSYLRHRKKFVRHPTLALGFVVYQFVRYLSSGLGFLVSKVRK